MTDHGPSDDPADRTPPPPPTGDPERLDAPALDGAGLDDEELISTWGLLTEAVNATTARLAADLDTAGLLTLAELDVLLRLYREPTHQLPVATIGAQLGLSTASAAKVVTRIEAAGLLATTSHPIDGGHAVHAALTDRGHDLTGRTLARHVVTLRRQLLHPLGVHGTRQLAVLTRAVRDHNT